MKKFITYFVVLCSWMATGCIREDFGPDDALSDDNDTFYILAHRENLQQTKTELLPDNTINWTKGDEIGFFFTPTSDCRKLVSKDIDNNGFVVFMYEGRVAMYPYGTHDKWAVYPYNARASIKDDVLSTYLPSFQTTRAERICLLVLRSLNRRRCSFAMFVAGLNSLSRTRV